MVSGVTLQQLPLEFQPRERLDFSLFIAGANSDCCQRVQAQAAGESAQVYLWGGSGAGKTHLLQAACQAAVEQARRAVYLPLRDMSGHDPRLLEGLEVFDLIVMDDMQSIAGDTDWEQAVFALYNSARDSGRALLIAADSSPRGLLLQLPDLASRLGWGEVYHLQPLTDEDKCRALMKRAAARGIELPAEVANYLLRRTVRNMAGLMAWLDHLDHAQLAAQRRLSIPFVKALLEDSGLTPMIPAIGRVPISHGLTWFVHGWRGFANAPGLLIGVMLVWLIVAIGLSLIPLLGSLVSTIIWPALFGGYLLMCRAAIDDSDPTLEQFFAGLTRKECRTDAIVLGLLLLVGHLLAMIITTVAFLLFCLLILGGIPWDLLAELREGSPESVTLNIGMLLVFGLTVLVALVPYTLLAMAMTYGAPLVVDNRSTALSALGVSINACLRNILPLSVFALIYLVLAVVAMIPLGLGLLLFIPVSMAALAASYRDIFGESEIVNRES